MLWTRAWIKIQLLNYDCCCLILYVYSKCFPIFYIHLAHTHTHTWRHWRTVCCSHSHSPCVRSACVNTHSVIHELRITMRNARTRTPFAVWSKKLRTKVDRKKTILLLTLRLAFELRPFIRWRPQWRKKKQIQAEWMRKEIEKRTQTLKKNAYACMYIHTFWELVLGIEHIKLLRMVLNFCGEYFKRSNRTEEKIERLTNM